MSHTRLSHLSGIAPHRREHQKVCYPGKGSIMRYFHCSIDRRTDLDAITLHPRLLSGVRHAALSWQIEPRMHLLRNVMHLSEQRHQHGRLPRPRGADDDVEAAFLEHQVTLYAKTEALSRWRRGAFCALRAPCKVGVAEADVLGVVIGTSGIVDVSLLRERVEQLSLHIKSVETSYRYTR